MDDRHLTPAELLAWIAEPSLDTPSIRHALRCPICRVRRRNIETGNSTPDDGRDPGRHVNDEVLVAYAEGRTINGDTAAVETHMLVCDDCLESLRLVEMSVASSAKQPGAPARVVARALDAFRRFTLLETAERVGTLRFTSAPDSKTRAFSFRFEPRNVAGSLPVNLVSFSPQAFTSARKPTFRVGDEIDAAPLPSAPGPHGGEHAVPGSLSLSLGLSWMRVEIDAYGGRVRLRFKAARFLQNADIVAIDSEGRAVDVHTRVTRGERLLEIAGGTSHILIIHPDRTWAVDVVL